MRRVLLLVMQDAPETERLHSRSQFRRQQLHNGDPVGDCAAAAARQEETTEHL